MHFSALSAESVPDFQWSHSSTFHHHLPRSTRMAATRFILAPLGGVFVATSLLYTFRHTIAVRTHDTAVTLNRIKLQLNDIDPDNWDKEGKERVTREQLRPAYVAPQRPSVTEEIKSRWNVSCSFSSSNVDWLNIDVLPLR